LQQSSSADCLKPSARKTLTAPQGLVHSLTSAAAAHHNGRLICCAAGENYVENKADSKEPPKFTGKYCFFLQVGFIPTCRRPWLQTTVPKIIDGMPTV